MSSTSGMDLCIAWIFTVFISALATSDQRWAGCLSPQYLELGRLGVLTCQFPANFKAIYWFDNATFDDATPVVTYKNNQKDGTGYLNGEYNINSNGSLVILSVTLQHEKMYKVLSFHDDDLYSVFRISVVVMVSPVQQKPFIEQCRNNEKCVIEANPRDVLRCSFAGARPPVQLEWFVMKDGREVRVNSSYYVDTEEESPTYETVSEITLPDLSRGKLLWMVCRSKQTGIARWDNSDVLVEMHGHSLEMIFDNKEIRYFEIEKRATLDFSIGSNNVLLWKKCFKHQCFFVAFKKGTQTTIVEGFDDHFNMDEDGSLIINTIQLFHEGNYTCLTSESSTEHSPTVISLIVLVPPSPSYLIVTECYPAHDCTVRSTGNGTLTCGVHRVRPSVTLTWTTQNSQHVSLISVDKSSSKEREFFDISATVRYKIMNKPDCGQTFKLECRAHGPATAIFFSRREVILEQENCIHSSSSSGLPPAARIPIIGTMVTFGVCVLTFLACGIRKWKSNRKKSYRNQTDYGKKEEQFALQEDVEGEEPEHKNIKNRIRQRLKVYYERTFGGDRDDSFIRKNYVPNYLSFFTGKPWHDDNLWEPLNSWEDIFQNHEMKDRHVIIEGGVGYGKSTLAKYLALEWCKESGSVLSSCEILLFVSLGHIGDKHLFDFILSTLLQDWTLQTKGDLETIIRRTKNVWIILDDFDGYIDKSFSSSEISQLLRDNKNTNFKIIVLARPYCFLNIGDIQIPIVKLEPFTGQQIETFVGKQFDENENLQSQFLTAIKTQEDLYSMCHVPLYLHIISSSYIHNRSIPREVLSMTTFLTFVFKYLLTREQETSSEKHQMKLTTNDDITFHYNLIIAKLSVDGIKTSTSLWNKTELQEKIEMNRLLNVGMLVQTNKPETLSSDLQVQNHQRVAFAHQIYQCYYGAHFLAYNIDKEDVRDYLRSLDVKNSAYLLIFTCGLCKNDSLFELIVKELLSKKDYFPYPVNDCLAHCFYERRFSQTETYRRLLQGLVNSEHRLHFTAEDERNLSKAKAFIVDTCSQLKIPVAILSFANSVTRIADNCCYLKQEVKFSIPADVQTIYIIDLENKLSVSDIMGLLKIVRSIEDIVVYSYAVPQLHDKVDIPEDKTDVKVIWISFGFEDKDVSILSYPSINFNLWLNCHGTRVVKRLRKQERWKNATSDERNKMELEILESINEKGFEEVIGKEKVFSKEETDKLREQHSTDLEAVRGFIREFHRMFEAKTKEIHDHHKKNLLKHIKELIFADKLDMPETFNEDEGTDLHENKSTVLSRGVFSDEALTGHGPIQGDGKFEELVSGLKSYYKKFHI